MSAISSLRQTRAGKARRLLGVLAVLWFNMAVQPCAMAADDDHDCPHCPPAHENTMAGHHAHGASDAKMPCAALEAQCADVGDVSVETRAELNPGDLDQPVWFVTDTIPTLQPVAPRIVGHATDPPDICGTSPPTHLLNCVFLK